MTYRKCEGVIDGVGRLEVLERPEELGGNAFLLLRVGVPEDPGGGVQSVQATAATGGGALLTARGIGC